MGFDTNNREDCHRAKNNIVIYSCIGCEGVNCTGCDTMVLPPPTTERMKKRRKEKDQVKHAMEKHVCAKQRAPPIGAKPCPLCSALIVKSDGCNSMRCKIIH